MVETSFMVTVVKREIDWGRKGVEMLLRRSLFKSMKREERRPYILITLMVIVFLFLSILVLFFLYIHYYGITPITRLLLIATGTLTFFILILFLLGIFVTISALHGKYPQGFFKVILKLVISHILPLLMRLGSMVGFDRERLEGTFIQLSNTIQKNEGPLNPAHLLILIPHCVQMTTCKYRITHDLDNCRQCGSCQVGDLFILKKRYGFQMSVVNGGTQARAAIKEVSPSGIVAVACERDLSSGIMDTFPLPVYGVINIRPEGPCINTRIPLDSLEEGIRSFLRRETI